MFFFVYNEQNIIKIVGVNIMGFNQLPVAPSKDLLTFAPDQAHQYITVFNIAQQHFTAHRSRKVILQVSLREDKAILRSGEEEYVISESCIPKSCIGTEKGASCQTIQLHLETVNQQIKSVTLLEQDKTRCYTLNLDLKSQTLNLITYTNAQGQYEQSLNGRKHTLFLGVDFTKSPELIGEVKFSVDPIAHARLAGMRLTRQQLTDICRTARAGDPPYLAPLQGIDLTSRERGCADDLDLNGMDFSHSDLRNVKIDDDTVFAGITLRDAKLHGLKPTKKQLIDICNKANKSIPPYRAPLAGCDLRGLNLRDVDFGDADLSDVQVDEGTAFNGVHYKALNLTGVKLSTEHVKALVKSAQSAVPAIKLPLKGADISQVDFSKLNPVHIDFTAVALSRERIAMIHAVAMSNLKGETVAQEMLALAINTASELAKLDSHANDTRELNSEIHPDVQELVNRTMGGLIKTQAWARVMSTLRQSRRGLMMIDSDIEKIKTTISNVLTKKITDLLACYGTLLSKTDVSGVNLGDLHLPHIDWTGISLSQQQIIDICNTARSGTPSYINTVKGINFNGVNMDGVDLTGLPLTRTQIIDLCSTAKHSSPPYTVLLIGVIVTGIDFKGIDLRHAHLKNVDLTPQQVADINEMAKSANPPYHSPVTDVRLTEVVSYHNYSKKGMVMLRNLGKHASPPYEADLTYANVCGMDLSYMDLSDVDFSHARFDPHTRLHGTNLRNTKLVGVSLSTRQLEDLCMAPLPRVLAANPFEASLEGVTFDQVDSSYRALSDARLSLIGPDSRRSSLFNEFALIQHRNLLSALGVNSGSNDVGSLRDSGNLRPILLNGVDVTQVDFSFSRIELINKTTGFPNVDLTGTTLSREQFCAIHNKMKVEARIKLRLLSNSFVEDVAMQLASCLSGGSVYPLTEAHQTHPLMNDLIREKMSHLEGYSPFQAEIKRSAQMDSGGDLAKYSLIQQELMSKVQKAIENIMMSFVAPYRKMLSKANVAQICMQDLSLSFMDWTDIALSKEQIVDILTMARSDQYITTVIGINFKNINMDGISLAYLPLTRTQIMDLCNTSDEMSSPYTILLDCSNVEHVDFKGVNLKDASLRYVSLTRQQVIDICNTARAATPPYPAPLMDTNLEGVDLREIDLSDANLQNITYNAHTLVNSTTVITRAIVNVNPPSIRNRSTYFSQNEQYVHQANPLLSASIRGVTSELVVENGMLITDPERYTPSANLLR